MKASVPASAPSHGEIPSKSSATAAPTLTRALSTVLADIYLLALKTQNFHWNVEGANFYSLHKMFEEQYSAMHETADEIAERIRMLGEQAPGSFRAFQQLSVIEEAPNGKISAQEMVRVLQQDHATLAARLKEISQFADDAGDAVSVGMLDELCEFHQKTAWMLRATAA